MINNQYNLAPSGSTLRISTADMVALKVRIRGTHRPEPPEFFYQTLPPDGGVLLATIPACGELAVSIPAGDNSWRGGWQFSATAPEFAVGPVIVYKLQPNCRYEAVDVHENGRKYTLEEFIEIARKRTQDHFGNLEKIPGQYVYGVPEKEEWESILRDDGYAATNPVIISKFHSTLEVIAKPSHIARPHNIRAGNAGFLPHWGGICGKDADVARSFAITSSVLSSAETERYGHLIQIRAPLYSGDKFSSHEPLPVFSRVEVLMTNTACGENRWLDFEEYRKTRASTAVVPHGIVAAFDEWLACLTRESGFNRWRFRPGMTFGERIEWWGPRGRRRTVHEGLDFVEGFIGDEVRMVPEGVPARAIAQGEVVDTLDDFMGKTVIMRHSSPALPGGEVFHTLLSHIQTDGSPPSCIKKGEVLGRIGRRADIRIRPHLHLTGAWLPPDFPFRKAGINTIIHPGFTPTILADLNDLIEKSPLCVISPDDREFLRNG